MGFLKNMSYLRFAQEFASRRARLAQPGKPFSYRRQAHSRWPCLLAGIKPPARCAPILARPEFARLGDRGPLCAATIPAGAAPKPGGSGVASSVPTPIRDKPDRVCRQRLGPQPPQYATACRIAVSVQARLSCNVARAGSPSRANGRLRALPSRTVPGRPAGGDNCKAASDQLPFDQRHVSEDCEGRPTALCVLQEVGSCEARVRPPGME